MIGLPQIVKHAMCLRAGFGSLFGKKERATGGHGFEHWDGLGAFSCCFQAMEKVRNSALLDIQTAQDTIDHLRPSQGETEGGVDPP